MAEALSHRSRGENPLAELESFRQQLDREVPTFRAPSAGLDARFYATSYTPTLRDRIAAYLAGDTPLGIDTERALQRRLGTTGTGPKGPGLIDFVGAGQALDAADHAATGDYAGVANDLLRASRVTAPFVLGRRIARDLEHGRAVAPTQWTTAAIAGLLYPGGVDPRADVRAVPGYGPPPAYGATLHRNRLAGND